jgi:hypothetical protein
LVFLCGLRPVFFLRENKYARRNIRLRRVLREKAKDKKSKNA